VSYDPALWRATPFAWVSKGCVGLAAVLLASSITTGSVSAATTYSKAKLRSLLLTVSDLPSGWSIDNSSSNGNGPTPSCLSAYEHLRPNLTRADVEFWQDGSAPVFLEGVVAGGDDAHLYYARATKALAGCSSISFTTQGLTLHGHMTGLSVPKVGNESRAYAFRFTFQGIPLFMDIDILRQGELVGTTIFVDLGSSESGTFTQLTREAVNKLKG